MSVLDGLKFPYKTPRMKPMWRQEVSRTAGGVTLVKEMGPLLWKVSYLTIPMPRMKAGEVEADLLALENGALTFKGYDPARPFPAATSATSASVSGIGGDRRSLSLSGAGTITKGDWISIAAGGNLHLVQAVSTGTGSIQVRPGLRPEISTGATATLRYASANFAVDPGSVTRVGVYELFDTVSWTATQVIT